MGPRPVGAEGGIVRSIRRNFLGPIMTSALLAIGAGQAPVSTPGTIRPGAPGPTPARTPAPAPSRTPAPSQTPEPQATAAGATDLEDLLKHLGERAHAYEVIALRFVCIESVRTSDEPRKERHYDYMYVQEEQQRYKPYRQAHTGRLGKTVAESAVDFDFPDAYSWTLMFVPGRQSMFHFRYAGQEWFSLRQAYIIEFGAALPFTSGKTIYEWSGRVWVDAENYNILKVEAEPGNQSERIKDQLDQYRRSPRFLIYPMGKRPHGYRYNITFLNELHEISLPDYLEYRSFTLDLQGDEEWESQTVLRYSGYQFFGVDVRELFHVQ